MRRHIPQFRNISECKSIEDFRATGHIIPAELFCAVRPDETLHEECTDVILYVSGLYIQMLKSGMFYYGNQLSKDAEIFELAIWDMNKTINK